MHTRVGTSSLVLATLCLIASAANVAASSGKGAAPAMVRLPGHVLSALARASKLPQEAAQANEPITLTIVLKRDNQAGFEKYLHEVYDPHSKEFHRFLKQREIADRFGPTRHQYDSTLHYLIKNGFRLVQGSKNRLTITVRGTRSNAEKAFAVNIRDYRIGDSQFHANDADPRCQNPSRKTYFQCRAYPTMVTLSE